MGRYSIVLSAVMIEPCREETCLQRVELPLCAAIISVYLAQAVMWRGTGGNQSEMCIQKHSVSHNKGIFKRPHFFSYNSFVSVAL